VEQYAENAQDMQSTGMLNARRATQTTVAAATTRGLILRRCSSELRMTIAQIRNTKRKIREAARCTNIKWKE